MKASDLVARFGGHPVGELGIDLETNDGPGRWLVAACLYGGRVDARIALAATRALDAAGLADPTSVARAPRSARSTAARRGIPRRRCDGPQTLARLRFAHQAPRRIARLTRRAKRTPRRSRGATRQPGTGIRRRECRWVLAPASRPVGPGPRDSAAPGRARRGGTPWAVGRRAGRGGRTGRTARRTARRSRTAFARGHRICTHENRKRRLFEKSSDSLPSRRRLSSARHQFAGPGVKRKHPVRSLRVGSTPPSRVIVDR